MTTEDRPSIERDALSTMSSDGIAQEEGMIGQNGELTNDLERKKLLLRELVPVYQKAFAGLPWYEVSQCSQSPSGFSAQRVGELCQCPRCIESGAPTRLTTEAYPADQLYESLLSRSAGPDSVVYVECLPDGRPVLGAILCPMSEESVIDKYAGRVDETWLRTMLPEKVLWLSEIFADLDARASGNLGNLQEVIAKSAENANTDTVAFRTINERLSGKIKSIYRDRATILSVPDSANGGKSYFVIIKL